MDSRPAAEAAKRVGEKIYTVAQNDRERSVIYTLKDDDDELQDKTK